MIQKFLDRGTALLTVLPDRHDMIACISSSSQFNILKANKVKGLVVLNKTYQPFSFMSPPNSIALGLGLRSYKVSFWVNHNPIIQLKSLKYSSYQLFRC